MTEQLYNNFLDKENKVKATEHFGMSGEEQFSIQ